MKMSTELYQMILTLMVPSMYPIVLKNARRKNVISYTMSSFNYEVNAYNRKIEERSNELMNTTSADAIKSCSNDPYKLVDIKEIHNNFNFLNSQDCEGMTEEEAIGKLEKNISFCLQKGFV